MYANTRKHIFVHNPGQCACAEGCVLLVNCKHHFMQDQGQCACVEGCVVCPHLEVLVYALAKTVRMRSAVFNARSHYEAPVLCTSKVR